MKRTMREIESNDSYFKFRILSDSDQAAVDRLNKDFGTDYVIDKVEGVNISVKRVKAKKIITLSDDPI